MSDRLSVCLSVCTFEYEHVVRLNIVYLVNVICGLFELNIMKKKPQIFTHTHTHTLTLTHTNTHTHTHQIRVGYGDAREERPLHTFGLFFFHFHAVLYKKYTKQ